MCLHVQGTYYQLCIERQNDYDEQQINSRIIKSLETSNITGNLQDAQRLYQLTFSTLKCSGTFVYIYKVRITDSTSKDRMTTSEEQINARTIRSLETSDRQCQAIYETLKESTNKSSRLWNLTAFMHIFIALNDRMTNAKKTN